MNLASEGTRRAKLNQLYVTLCPSLTSYVTSCKSLHFSIHKFSYPQNKFWAISLLRHFPVTTFYILNIYEILPLSFSSRYLRTFILLITLCIIIFLRSQRDIQQGEVTRSRLHNLQKSKDQNLFPCIHSVIFFSR